MFCCLMQDTSYCTLAYIILFHITITVIVQSWRYHHHVHTFSVANTLLNLIVMQSVSRAKEMLCNNALYPDLYGHYREAKFTQTKHHWWWKANRVFNQLEVTRNHTGMSVQPAGGYTQPHRYVCSTSWRLHTTTQVCLLNIEPSSSVLVLLLHILSFLDLALNQIKSVVSSRTEHTVGIVLLKQSTQWVLCY